MFESKRLWMGAAALLVALGLATACMSAPARGCGSGDWAGQRASAGVSRAEAHREWRAHAVSCSAGGRQSSGGRCIFDARRRSAQRRGGSDRSRQCTRVGADASGFTPGARAAQRRGEYAGVGQPLRQAATAVGGRDRDRRQAGPHRRDRPHRSGGRGAGRPFGVLH